MLLAGGSAVPASLGTGLVAIGALAQVAAEHPAAGHPATGERADVTLGQLKGLTGELRLAHRDVGGWHIETVAPVPGLGWSSDLVLDAQGKPHITYQDGYNGDLRYAHLLAGDHFLYLPLVSGQ